MAAIPPQFLKNTKAPAGPSGPIALTRDKKKKTRKKAIADMQAKDAQLDAKLGPNDTADKTSGGSKPPWLKGR